MQNFDGEYFRNGKLERNRAEKILLREVDFEDMMSLCISGVEYSVTRIFVKRNPLN